MKLWLMRALRTVLSFFTNKWKMKLGSPASQKLESRIERLEATSRSAFAMLMALGALEESHSDLNAKATIEEEIAYVAFTVGRLERNIKTLNNVLSRVRVRLTHLERKAAEVASHTPKLPSHQDPRSHRGPLKR